VRLAAAPGSPGGGQSAELSEEDWDFVIGVNLKGAFLMCRAVLSSMLAAKAGTIVNVGRRYPPHHRPDNRRRRRTTLTSRFEVVGKCTK
jgi:NAD(P)-dependent dehydrogenase (short-subunit alcohol dehydrogenase family)